METCEGLCAVLCPLIAVLPRLPALCPRLSCCVPACAGLLGCCVSVSFAWRVSLRLSLGEQ